MRSIVLASTSPRRAALLNQLGIPFQIVKPEYEEDMTLDMTPEKLVKYLALQKALSVVHTHENSLIISADTIIEHAGRAIGKPKSEADAKQMLQMLSGTTHHVLTGLAIVDTSTKEQANEVVKATLTLRKITDEEIDAYIRSQEPLDKAGAYAINGKGAIFIEEMCGDYHAIVGLPLYRLTELLVNTFHITIW